MSLNSGERQVSENIDDIRRDHVARYEWAAGKLPFGSRVADLACGIGYGSSILAQSGKIVVGIDQDLETIEFAKTHYAHANASYHCAPLKTAFDKGGAIISFETIEHVSDPLQLLREMRELAPVLFASVPNEDYFPWNGHSFHYRHYTKAEFEALLNAAGWQVQEWHGQEGPESEVEPDCGGRTLIAVCAHGEVKPLPAKPEVDAAAVPDHVAILGMGPSLGQFVEIAKRLGGRSKFCDEVWAINALGDVLACDRIFHMDDVRIQQVRADADPASNTAAMLNWVKKHPGPIYTSRLHEDYAGLVEYPLEEVINNVGFAYFNSTAAYAVAYAIYLGVKKISLFGIDFTYPNAHHAEKGRACVEFLLGIAAARGIQLSMPKVTSLMDSCAPQAERLYGYDTLDVQLAKSTDGLRVIFKERETIATAEEVERNYDHAAHPNPLVREAPETVAAKRAPEVK